MWPLLIVVALAFALYLFRRPSPPAAVPVKPSRRARDVSPKLPGNGRYQMDIVGESRYQKHLAVVCDGTTEYGVNLQREAVLILERDNPYDRNAVAVHIQGGQVGHLSRDLAVELRSRIAKSEWAGAERFRCPAQIRGGWDRGGSDKGMFGVCLDVDLHAL